MRNFKYSGLLLLSFSIGSHLNAQWSIGTDIYNTNSGNVGIGLTTPTAKLDVVGSIKTSNGLVIGGTIGGTWEPYGTSLQLVGTASTGSILMQTNSDNSAIRLRVNG